MRVFTLLDCYLPGFKHGGPIRTVANMVARMPREFEFWIYTRDRDRGDDAPYPGVRVDVWNDVDGAKVFYGSRAANTVLRIRRELARVRPGAVYSNSLFSPLNLRFMFARSARLVEPVPFVLAPRGECAPGALALKAWKKRPFLRVARAMGFFDDVVWQASSEFERKDILAAIGGTKTSAAAPTICVAPDLIPPRVVEGCSDPCVKRSGSARFVFLSRVTKMKNLPFALDAMRDLSGDVSLDIYGPLDDPECWRECQAAIGRARPNVRVAYRGAVAPGDVTTVLARYEFLVLPTLGENFGHVIFESLSAGCPVVLSDRTMWKALREEGAGWVLSLDDRRAWTAALQACVAMGAEEHATMRAAARRTAACAESADAVERNVNLFETAVGQHAAITL